MKSNILAKIKIKNTPKDIGREGWKVFRIYFFHSKKPECACEGCIQNHGLSKNLFTTFENEIKWVGGKTITEILTKEKIYTLKRKIREDKKRKRIYYFYKYKEEN